MKSNFTFYNPEIIKLIYSCLFFLLFLPALVVAQDSTFTVNDSVIGKVEMEYLDKNWKVVSKEKSFFYRYKYTFNKIPYAPIYDEFKHDHLKTNIILDSLKMGEPVILNGDFFWYNRKGKMVGEFHYKNGVAVGTAKNYKNYFFFFLFYKTRICEEVDYDKKHPNFAYGYYYKEYRLNGKVKFEGYYRNGDKNIGLYEWNY